MLHVGDAPPSAGIMSVPHTIVSPPSDEHSVAGNTLEPTGLRPRSVQKAMVHTCGTCFRSFNRREHRIRHERCRTFLHSQHSHSQPACRSSCDLISNARPCVMMLIYQFLDTNEKPYECTICHRRYARQYADITTSPRELGYV